MKKQIEPLEYRDSVADDIPESLLLEVLEAGYTTAEDKEKIRQRLAPKPGDKCRGGAR